MNRLSVSFTPYADQKAGTSGLRKPTRTFRQPHYLAAFVQAVFDVRPPQGTLILGGDGRDFCAEAAQTIVKIALANGCPRLVVGRNALVSTPSASQLIRDRGAWGGLLLSASHNPGGPDGDFGVKVNGPNGAPAPEALTEAVYRRTRELTHYALADVADIDLARLGETTVGGATIEVVDPTARYAELMERLFDFDRIAALVRSPGFSLKFDAMSAVTGPYAREVFERRLGIQDAVMRGDPLPDFGGGHPDPTLANAEDLAALMAGPNAPRLGAASDGDGDRHLVMGPRFPVNPSDSLAILLEHADVAPGYAGRLTGVARSMPTSRAVDAVARERGLPLYETPTGWKFFASLLDSGRITLCGEESAGAGSDHVREKDGLWAVLFWLNIMAATGRSVEEIVRAHWARYGRYAALRLDLEDLPTDRAGDALQALRRALPGLAGRSFTAGALESADDFSYVDPVDGSEAARQGLRLNFAGGGRIVMRLSGTGTGGATLRVYLDRPIRDAALIGESPSRLLELLEQSAQAVLESVDAELFPTMAGARRI